LLFVIGYICTIKRAYYSSNLTTTTCSEKAGHPSASAEFRNECCASQQPQIAWGLRYIPTSVGSYCTVTSHEELDKGWCDGAGYEGLSSMGANREGGEDETGGRGTVG
jgi:hypothetical protein